MGDGALFGCGRKRKKKNTKMQQTLSTLTTKEVPVELTRVLYRDVPAHSGSGVGVVSSRC